MSLLQCPRSRELPCFSMSPKQSIKGSRESCQVRTSEPVGTELTSLLPHSPGTSVHQFGSQAWPAPHCQGVNCTKCQEVSCAVLPRHGQGSALRRLQKVVAKGLCPLGSREGVNTSSASSESSPNAHCRHSTARGLSQSRCEVPAAHDGSDHILSSAG